MSNNQYSNVDLLKQDITLKCNESTLQPSGKSVNKNNLQDTVKQSALRALWCIPLL